MYQILCKGALNKPLVDAEYSNAVGLVVLLFASNMLSERGWPYLLDFGLDGAGRG